MSLDFFTDKNINSDAQVARRSDFLSRMERKLEFKTAMQEDHLSSDR